MSRWHSDKIPEPLHLVSINVEEQRLDSESLLNGQSLHLVFKGEPRQTHIYSLICAVPMDKIVKLVVKI